jgi:hypothetical protein
MELDNQSTFGDLSIVLNPQSSPDLFFLIDHTTHQVFYFFSFTTSAYGILGHLARI